MQVALIANDSWLDEELPVFRHLLVGLLDEQVRTVQVIPRGVSQDELSFFGQRVIWEDQGLRFIRRRNLSRVADQIENIQVNVLHALDGRVWKGVYDIARQLQCAVVFQAGSMLDLPLAHWLSKRIDVSRMAVVATTEPLANAMRDIFSNQTTIATIQPGTYPTDIDDALKRIKQWEHDISDGTVCMALSGNAQFDADYEALFSALPSVLADYPHLQFFVDNMGLQQHQLWRAARRYGLLSNLSFVPRRLGHRELLLRADVLIHPQAMGRSRSLTIQAMAAGVPVIAREDPWLDYIIEDQTAWVVSASKADIWSQRLRQLIEQPNSARELGQRARQWVDQHRLASTHVDKTRMLYHQISGEGIKIQQSR